ncbi:hypothetical protein D7Y56_00700 (plasmid) [Streptomyces sp. S501]|uniref:hypothetical protein n=1 Tax=Streptomyces sp. S501 TaxID=2420135 RepID=UPI00106E97DB|nr:hypothetical protein [Streptomyces sp. S501]QBR04588.1 hypothetical protein D7Y56_00700 [Streptomyces sp. S501]
MTPVVLSSTDLTLRPWEPGDADALAVLADDEELRRSPALPPSDARSLLPCSCLAASAHHGAAARRLLLNHRWPAERVRPPVIIGV